MACQILKMYQKCGTKKKKGGDDYYYYYYIAVAIELCSLFVENATLQASLHPQVKEKPTWVGS